MTAPADKSSRLHRSKREVPGLAFRDIHYGVELFELQSVLGIDTVDYENQRLSPLYSDRVGYESEPLRKYLDLACVIVSRK